MFHVVPTLRAALKAVDAGVDGLVVEGGEGGGFKNPRAGGDDGAAAAGGGSKVDVPIIAAGGIVDGATMAAAFALGAEGMQMGTRMVSAAESPIHDNWKQAIVDAAETDTVFLNQHASPALRALRTERTTALEFDHERNAMEAIGQHGRPLLRRRHGGGHRAVRPGRRAHRRGAPGRRHHRRDAPATASAVLADLAARYPVTG